MSTAAHIQNDITLFRGRSLEDLLPQIREQLGPDAVVLRRRDGVTGGIAGFFQRRCIEVEARAGAPRVDTYDDLDSGGRGGEGLGDLGSGGQPGEAFGDLGSGGRGGEGLGDLGSGGPSGEAFGDLGSGFSWADPSAARSEAAEAIDEGMRAPVVRALVASASPFADQLAVAEAQALLPATLAPDVGAAEPAVEREVGVAVEPAVEQEVGVAVEPAVQPEAPVAVELAGRRPAAADALEAALVEGGLSPALAAAIVAETVTHLLPFGTPRQLRRLVRRALARRVAVQPLRARGGAVVAFAGAGGVGKTLTVARLARAYATRSDQPVAVIALRPVDGGERLAALLSPFEIPVDVAKTAAAARKLIEGAGPEALVLVDTTSVSPVDAAGIGELAADLAKLRAEVQLCVPGTLGASAARVLMEGFGPLKPAALAITHLDETLLAGAAIEPSMTGGPPLSLLSEGVSLEGGLDVADPVAAVALLLR
ncbi:MAG: hypothetical protein LT070_11465 [Solirubrobacteraceae bacterium]|nr:hypothetical protein [Solirubrobacteraceae bacterium]